jgi:hypothetical protein
MRIFLDGVPYSISDSVIGIWLVNLLTGRRYLSVAIRKKLLCDCGCRGWCSLYRIFKFIHWWCVALAEGANPSTRHDQRPWTPLDPVRSANAGAALRFRACILFTKGDWVELATSLGIPSHNDGLIPCFKCNASSISMCVCAGCTPAGLVWRLNQEGEYDDACARCDFVVTLDAVEHASVNGLLDDDKRPSGSLGRALLRSFFVGGKQLLKGDRLEPCAAVPTIEQLASVTIFPIVGVTFWRRSAEVMSRHRNPIFDASIGITPHRSLTVDTLHGFILVS